MGDLTHLRRSSRCILQPHPTGETDLVSYLTLCQGLGKCIVFLCRFHFFFLLCRDNSYSSSFLVIFDLILYSILFLPSFNLFFFSFITHFIFLSFIFFIHFSLHFFYLYFFHFFFSLSFIFFFFRSVFFFCSVCFLFFFFLRVHLTFSRYPSLSATILSKSSRQHPVFAQS